MRIFTVPLGKAWIAMLALLVPVASLLFLSLASAGKLTLLSEKELVAAWSELDPGAQRPLYYLNYLPTSATFYSKGRVSVLTGAGGGLPAEGFWLAVHRTEGDASAWDCELRHRPKTGLFDLYDCSGEQAGR